MSPPTPAASWTGLLATAAAHDINNLLMVILCYVELVLDRMGDDAPARRDALEIKTAAESAARVTTELVALSQQQELLPRPLDVSAIVDELGFTLRGAVGEAADLVLVGTWTHGLFVVGQGPFGASALGALPFMHGKKAAVFCTFALSPAKTLDKMTGKTLWKSAELNDEAGYSSIVVADVQGVRTLMTLTSEAGVGVRASDGKLMWHHARVANGTANVATPIFFDNKVFYSSDYGTGGALLGLTAQNGLIKAQEIYFTREMQNHHGGVLLATAIMIKARIKRRPSAVHVR